MINLNKILLNIFGILLTSIGLTFIILNFNLLIINYTFIDYLVYILTHLSTLSFFIGILLIIICHKFSR